MLTPSRSRIATAAIAVLLLALLAAPSQAASITLGWRGFDAKLEVQATQTVTDTLIPTVVPWTDSHMVESNGDRSEASYVLTNDGLHATFDLVNSAAENSLAHVRSEFRFSVDEEVSVVFAGQFTTTGSVRRVYQRLMLREVGADIYVRTQESRSTADESFTLGLQEGDSFNQSVGTTFNRLLPGHEYILLYDAFAQVLGGDAAGPATATGFFTMSLPEPSTALLTTLGLLLAASLGRRP